MSGSNAGLVGFTYTPPNLRVPLFSFEVTSAGGATQANQRVLLIGSASTAQPLVPVQIFGPANAASLFGASSMLARMAAKYALNDGYGEVWALPAPSFTATEAVNQAAVVGVATTPATGTLYAGDQKIPFSMSIGDTAATIAGTLSAAVNAMPTVPLANATVAPNGGASVVTLPCEFLGAMGNSLSIGLNLGGARAGEALPAGVTISIAQTVQGSGVPVWPDLRAVLGDANFDLIVCGFTDSGSRAAVSALLADNAGRWSPVEMDYGHCYAAASGPTATLAANAALGGTLNDQHLTMWGTPGIPTPPWEVAAAVGGATFPSLKADPGRPLQTLPVLGVMAPSVGLSRTNQQALLVAGIALLAFDNAGNCSVLRAVTTYKANAFGVTDTSYLDTETLYELMLFNRTIMAGYADRFGRVKLADNGTHFGAGVAIVTPNDIRNGIIADYSQMETDGLVEDTAAFAAGLVVERNANDASRVDVLLDPTLVSGLRLLATLTKFSLTPPAQAAA